MGSHVGIIPFGIILTLTLQHFNNFLATASDESSIEEDPNCEERPPYCYGWIDASVRDFNDFLYVKKNSTFIGRYVQYGINSSSSQPVCSLDLLSESIHRDNASVVVISIQCSETGTRIVMKPGSKHINSSLVWFLSVTNCTVYWKDISKLGKHVFLWAMQLSDWQDEFTTGKPEYFNACVHLNQSDGGGNQLGAKLSIEGCTNIAELVVQNTIVRTASPVFARHLWPALAGLKLKRYEFSSDDTQELSEAMPLLQYLLMTDGHLNLEYLDFPWNDVELSFRFHWQRSYAYNIEIAEGISGLPSNVHGRSIQLKHVTLSDASNISFNGFLHSVQLINCSLTQIGPTTFTKLTSILAIYASNNRIAYLDKDSFSGLNKLLLINLNHNLITSLPREIFSNVPDLAHVLLQGNKLTHISLNMFMKLTQLTELDLSQNSLVSVSEDSTVVTALLHYDKLTRVDLSRNNLTHFPAWLLHWPFLVDVDLSNNRISFGGLIATLQTSMDISFDYLTSPGAITQIKTIKLQQNAFTEFDIATLDFDLLHQLRLLLTGFRLDFGEEVFNCDCKMYQLLEYLRNFDIQGLKDASRRILDYNRNGFSCLQPRELRGQPLLQVPVTALGCDKPLPSCPKFCRCWVRSMDGAVKVNCSHQNLTQLPDLIADRSITLDFSYNNLLVMPSDLPNYFKSLHLLDLSYNNLKNIDGNMFEARYNISDLRLHNNELIILPKEVKQLSYTVQLTLSGNRFACDCNTLWLKQWLVTRSHHVTDIDRVLCGSGQAQVLTQPILEVPDADFVCVRDTHATTIGLGALAGLLALLLAVIIIIYKYRGDIKVMLYFKLGWRPFDRRDDSDILDKEFDAFVSYHHQDSEWVRQELRPRLEDAEPRFRLCLHERDFVVGATVADNICTAVDISRRMVLLLSRAFLQSHWCHEEFRQAHYKVMEERTNYLILVLCEDVSVEDLDEEMRPYLRTNTYLRRDSRWFWEKLKYAMPQKPLLELQRDRNLPQNADWSGLYAIARAQQVDSILVGGDKRPTINIHCGSHQQNRGKINDRLMACGMGDDIPQGRDDIPLVKSAHNYINT